VAVTQTRQISYNYFAAALMFEGIGSCAMCIYH